MPDHNSLEYFVLNDVISDILRIFEPNRKECGKYLLAVGNSFEPGHFRSSHSNERDGDGDENMEEDAQGWCLADILLEVRLTSIDDMNFITNTFIGYHVTNAQASFATLSSSILHMHYGRTLPYRDKHLSLGSWKDRQDHVWPFDRYGYRMRL